MSNIVFPTQDHQVKAFEQQSSKKDDDKQNSNYVLPTQDHQLKLFEQKPNTGNVSNIVIPDNEQIKAFETKHTDLVKKQGEEEEDSEIHHTQFTTSIFNVLTSSKNTIFSKYTRQFNELARKLDSDTAQLIILSPTDSAIESLSKKPWEFPKEVNASNDSKDEISNSNIENFLYSHIVDSSKDFKKVAEGKSVSLTTINGNELTLSNSGDFEFDIIIDDKKVAKVVDTQVVGNGAMLTIDHPLEWPGK